MAMEPPAPLGEWYRKHVGTPSAGDEVLGYWVFTLGIVLGLAGLVAFFVSPTNSLGRMVGYMTGAVGLLLLVVGPTVRLPLSRVATTLSWTGAFLGLVAVAWFATVYPGGWERPAGNTGVVALYALGLLIAALAAIVAPAVTGTSDARATDEQRAESEASEAPDGDAGGEDEPAADETAAEEPEERDPEEPATERLAAVLADLEGTSAALERARQQVAEHSASQAAFELYRDRADEWRWRLRHRNGNVVADSGEGYASRQKAMQGLRSVKSNAFGAAVTAGTTAADPDPEEPPLLAESQATFEVYEDHGGEWRWRLRHDNGRILGDSGEGYVSRPNARRGVEAVRETADRALALDVDPVAFEVYVDEAGEWRWRLLHRNGHTMADSGEGYASRSNAYRAVESVRELAADEDSFGVFQGADGGWRWRLVAANGEPVADSGEGYSNRGGAEDAVERVSDSIAEADALAAGDATFEVFRDAADEWRWRLRARNGELVADSGEGYTERSAARAAVDRVKRHAPGASEDLEAVEVTDPDEAY